MISNFFLNIYDKLKRKMQTDYKISNELLTNPSPPPYCESKWSVFFRMNGFFFKDFFLEIEETNKLDKNINQKLSINDLSYDQALKIYNHLKHKYGKITTNIVRLNKVNISYEECVSVMDNLKSTKDLNIPSGTYTLFVSNFSVIYLLQGTVDKNDFSKIAHSKEELMIAYYRDDDFLMKDVYDYLVETYGHNPYRPNWLKIKHETILEYIGNFTKKLPL